jgi:hypothetical protein
MMVELRGRQVRVLVYRYDGNIHIEIGDIWDPLYERPVILVTSESRLKEDVEALIDEIAQLLRRAVEMVMKGEV